MNSEVRTEQSYMKKVLFGIGVLLLSPVLLFLLLPRKGKHCLHPHEKSNAA